MSDSEFQPLQNNDDDLVGKIVQANTLESSGKIEQAIALYKEIAVLDPQGNYGNVARQALENLQKATSKVDSTQKNTSEKSGSWWSKLSIRNKTITVLTGLTLASTTSISVLGYLVASRTVTQEINELELAQSYTLTKEIALFMQERFGDIQIMASLEVFSDSEIRAIAGQKQKQDILDKYVQSYSVYENIAAFDLKGDLIASSSGKVLGNHANRSYFQKVLETKQPFISQPIFSQSSDTLSIYTAAPIKDSKTGKTIGIVRARIPVEQLQDLMVIKGSKQKSYLLDDQGKIFLASEEAEHQKLLATAQKELSLEERFDFHAQLKQAWNQRHNVGSPEITEKQKVAPQQIFYGKDEVAYFNTLVSIDEKLISDSIDLGWSTVVSIDNKFAFATQKQLLQVFVISSIFVVIIVTILARLIADRAIAPIIEAAKAVENIGQGDFDTRVDVRGEDELASLGVNINKMVGQIQDLLHTQETEAKSQQEQKEILQRGVMSLLMEVEGAQRGDLTVRAAMTDGAVGSIADAFNSTISKLQELLQQVQTVSNDVGQLSLAGEGSVRQLSQSALNQAAEINQALSSIDEINRSVETVADYAQEAAQIARNGSIQAKEGDLAMDATVESIEKIRSTVASTSKKVKQLAESSQEIAQIVEIISGISEKTNLLAFNASVEAARAGEHGEGFRIVAEEVRRLADRITGSTKDIQQLVTTIQQDTTSVLQGMETSTTEVVNGSQLVHMTKLNLQSLAKTSQEIDEYLKSISTNTIKQTDNSKEVNEKINGIALVAKTNSTEAKNVLESLQTLVREAETLQSSVSKFKLQA